MLSSVYFIQDEATKAIKIGVSAEPDKRLGQLQTACPGQLRLIRTIRGDEHTEARLHQKFADKRVRGEWFNITEEEIRHELFRKTQREHWKDAAWEAPDLCFLLSASLGFHAEIRSRAGENGTDHRWYRIERSGHGGTRGEKFSAWYLIEFKQWFPNEIAAAATFLAAWQDWLSEERDPN